jgi:hypothetical protein
MISAEALKEFKELYQREYSLELTDEEATKKAISLLRLMKSIYQPIPKKVKNQKDMY